MSPGAAVTRPQTLLKRPVGPSAAPAELRAVSCIGKLLNRVLESSTGKRRGQGQWSHGELGPGGLRPPGIVTWNAGGLKVCAAEVQVYRYRIDFV